MQSDPKAHDPQVLRIDIDHLEERLAQAERQLADLVVQVEIIHDRLGIEGEEKPE
jgi:hypothetical protein